AHAHHDRAGVPAAGDQAAEDLWLRGLAIEVERLWVVLLGEGKDLLLGHRVAAEVAGIAELDVLPVLRPLPFSRLGSSAARSQSPQRWMASTSTRMARPGKSASH